MDITKLELIDLVDLQMNMQREAQIINQNLQAIGGEIAKRRDEHVRKRESAVSGQQSENQSFI
jgi:hypothetical protein